MKFIVTWEGMEPEEVEADTRYDAVMKAAENKGLKGRITAKGLFENASVKRPGKENLGRWSRRKKEDAVKEFLGQVDSMKTSRKKRGQ